MAETTSHANNTDQRLLLLMQLVQRLSVSANPDEVLNRVLDDVLAVTGAERGFVAWPETEEKKSRLPVVRGFSDDVITSSVFLHSRGVVKKVLESGQPIITDDAQSDSRFSANASIIGLHIRSIMCVPLVRNETVLAAIYVDNRAQKGLFQQTDLDLLSAIAASAATAIENSRLYAETQARLNSLDLLRKLNQDIASSLEVSQVLIRSVESIKQLIGGSTASILTVDGDHLTFRVSVGEKAVDNQPFKIPLEQGVAGWVVKNKQPVLLDDVANDSRFYGTLDKATGFTTKCLIAAPLMINEKAIGVVEIFNKENGFSEQDLDLLVTFSASVAIAIENARLYEETQARLATLDLLRSISLEITSTLDLNRVLSATTQAVKELLGGTAASILTVIGDELEFQVALGDSASSIKPQRVPIGTGLAGWVVENKKPVIVNDVRNDPRFFKSFDNNSGFTTLSLIAVPLLVNDTAIGVIEVFNKPEGFSQEDLELLETFASNAAFALENARLYQVAVEKGRLERELQVARQVQTSFLPREIPTISGWQLAARWIPAREVAGDYYDFIPLGHDAENGQSYGIAVADVADKGMPAALFMVNVRAILRASMFGAPDIAHAVSHTNTLASADSEDGMFVTLFYLKVEPNNAQVAYVNGGHNPPLLLRKGQKEPELLTRTGIALALFPDLEYSQALINLNSGDSIVMFTDGVPDALNEKDEEYGMERMTQVYIKNANKPAEQILAAIENDLQTHVGEANRFDDVTIVVLKKE